MDLVFINAYTKFYQNSSICSGYWGKTHFYIDQGPNNELVGTIMLDLSKAFDLVDHNILLCKLKCYQFSEGCLMWFISYLDQHQQQVSITGKLSNSKHISSGVPQGSVLGPLLFLLYINDLALEVNKSLLDFFADNTTLTVTGTSVEEMQRT